MGRWRVAALILAVGAFGLAALGPAAWVPAGFPAETGRSALFWLGVAGFLVVAWGRGGT